MSIYREAIVPPASLLSQTVAEKAITLCSFSHTG
jgi:hypothetical protein